MDLLKISEKYYGEMLKLTREIGAIPAPSGEEDERAVYVLNYMKKIGAENAYIDEAKNVICTLGEESNDMVAFMAHTDIVFPRETLLTVVEDEEYLRFPGVTDDVACLAVLLANLKYLLDEKIKPERTLMFVANSCEEGLGNLKGSRAVFNAYSGKISRMYTFDGFYTHLVNDSVGSHRYRVTALTEGGHSFGDFGNRNAINVLAGIIREIYKIEVPHVGESKTSYNVGIIEGGTSVNTIAQNASMLIEYRSDNAECLAEMKRRYYEIFEKARAECSELLIEVVGERPCKSGVDENVLKALTENARAIQEKYGKCTVSLESGSTDCNIPHSLGIPALCIGVCNGGGPHTREEWLEKKSLKGGFAIGLELMLENMRYEI